MRLIDADEIIKRSHDVIIGNGTKHRCFDTTLIHEIPTVDAVPVIRCKDCKHKYIENKVWKCPFGLPGGPDFWCGYGAERKEE